MNLLSIQLNVYALGNNYKKSNDKLHKHFDYRHEITLAQQGTQPAAEHTESLSALFHIHNDYGSCLGQPQYFSNHWYAHKTVAQTIRKQYKHTIGVFEWVSHNDGNCKVGRFERGRE